MTFYCKRGIDKVKSLDLFARCWLEGGRNIKSSRGSLIKSGRMREEKCEEICSKMIFWERWRKFEELWLKSWKILVILWGREEKKRGETTKVAYWQQRRRIRTWNERTCQVLGHFRQQESLEAFADNQTSLGFSAICQRNFEGFESYQTSLEASEGNREGLKLLKATKQVSKLLKATREVLKLLTSLFLAAKLLAKKICRICRFCRFELICRFLADTAENLQKILEVQNSEVQLNSGLCQKPSRYFLQNICRFCRII
jgi:hypothetical protein